MVAEERAGGEGDERARDLFHGALQRRGVGEKGARWVGEAAELSAVTSDFGLRLSELELE